MTKPFHDLYTHGHRLNILCKSFFTQFKKAEERGDDAMMLVYGEAFRKATVNIVDVACKVLGVQELIKGKRVTN